MINQQSSFALSIDLSDLSSGFIHLITSTLYFIGQSIISAVGFALYYGYTYLLYVILRVPRPKRSRKQSEDAFERPKPPPSFEPKMLRRRQYAVDELITSEYNYQQYISALIDVYEPAYSKILSEDDIFLFFGQIHPLIEMSKRVANIFESQCRRGAKDAEIGNLFLEKLDLVAGFVPFISTYLEINSRFNELILSDKKFIKLNEELEKKNEPFSSLIIMPVQRMPKYVLLLHEIFKATPDWHPDYQPLIEAEEKLKDDAKIADKNISEANRRGQLLRIEKTIRRCPDLLDNPNRRLISRFSPKESRTELYLLSDMIIIAKEKTETLSRKTFQEIKKMIDLKIIVSTEKIAKGLVLKSDEMDYFIEIEDRIDELQKDINEQIEEFERKKREKEEEEKRKKEKEEEEQRERERLLAVQNSLRTKTSKKGGKKKSKKK